MAGCLFCPEVARKRSAINIHLDQYVPEIAKARKIKLLSDNHHHVASIRHGRYPARGMWDAKNQPPQKEWRLEADPRLRLFFVEFGKRMVVSISKAVDAHQNRSWELVSIDFWNEAAHEGLQELMTIDDEDMHDEAVSQYVDNLFKDLEKTWATEMRSDASPVPARRVPSPSPEPAPPQPPPPAHKARRTNNNVDGDVHGDVITGFLLQNNGDDARRGASVLRTPNAASSHKRQRPASPGTPSVPIGILLSLRVLVLGSTTVLLHLEPGTTLREAIAEAIATAKGTMPELAHYAVDRFVLRGTGDDAPAEREKWASVWTQAVWARWVELAEESRAPPTWSASMVAVSVGDRHRE